MSSDDDTILSAYMDGQLDTGQQQRVEAALVAAPRLSENLRALTAVRDLVAGLPRDTGTDVAPEVMRRIRGLGRARPGVPENRPWAARARQMGVGAGVLSIGAGILLIVTVSFSSRRGDPGVLTAPRKVTDNVIAESRPDAGTASTNEQGIRVVLNPGSPSSVTATTDAETLETHSPAGEHHAAGAAAVDASSSHGDLQLSRRMLDNPAERRLFLIKSGADGKAQQQVATVVERTSRFGFFKITVSQGIVIDPRHPEEATVFALLVSPKELGHLRDQLKDAVPDMLEESRTDPAIVTQLADIGQVRQFAPVPAADIATPSEALALRTRVGAAENGAPAALPAAEVASGRPTPEQYLSAPIPDPASRSSSVSEPEHGTEPAAVDNGSRIAEAPVSARAHLPDPLAGAKLPPAKPEFAATAPGTAKSDEMILVFVWVCKSRPS